ncbi:MAG: hypothetical protein SGILL_006431, partial [Bacillariaceae sp.]
QAATKQTLHKNIQTNKPASSIMGILSDETKAFIADAFSAVDKDGSGTIDAGEIEAVLKDVAEKEGFEAPPKEKIQKRLDAIPTANPGSLTLPELVFIIGSLKVLAICLVLFMAADADESGVLEGPEIKNVITKVHENNGLEVPSAEEQDKIVSELDGKVYFDEFAAIVIPLILAAAGIVIE